MIVVRLLIAPEAAVAALHRVGHGVGTVRSAGRELRAVFLGCVHYALPGFRPEHGQPDGGERQRAEQTGTCTPRAGTSRAAPVWAAG